MHKNFHLVVFMIFFVYLSFEMFNSYLLHFQLCLKVSYFTALFSRCFLQTGLWSFRLLPLMDLSRHIIQIICFSVALSKQLLFDVITVQFSIISIFNLSSVVKVFFHVRLFIGKVTCVRPNRSMVLIMTIIPLILVFMISGKLLLWLQLLSNFFLICFQIQMFEFDR